MISVNFTAHLYIASFQMLIREHLAYSIEHAQLVFRSLFVHMDCVPFFPEQ